MSAPTVCHYPVVVFDLDGTLLVGGSVSLKLAEWLGRGEQILALERAYRAGEISNSVVADTQAAWFDGLRKEEVWEVLSDGEWIEGMTDTFDALRDAGARLLLATVTWSFAAEMVGEQNGFAAFSGTEMHCVEGVLKGTISRYFDEYDKLSFVRDWCSENGYSMSQVAAVGDSRSDVPLFGALGCSVALNATPDARAASTHQLDSANLTDILALLDHPPLA